MKYAGNETKIACLARCNGGSFPFRVHLVGEYLCWTLGCRALANATRDYTAGRLPEKLLG
jgi:hypothetical protein